MSALYARCRAVIFPAVEDYGIVPLEAAAAGRPTLALGRGGALETMVGLDAPGSVGEPPTAVFFAEQTVDAVVDAIARFEAARSRFDPRALRARATRFDVTRFRRRALEWIDAQWREFHARRAC